MQQVPVEEKKSQHQIFFMFALQIDAFKRWESRDGAQQSSGACHNKIVAVMVQTVNLNLFGPNLPYNHFNIL